MSRYLRLIAVCAGLLASAGCSRERRLLTAPTPAVPTGPTEPAPPQPSASQRLAAFALLEAVNVHQGLTTSPLIYATQDGRVANSGPCVWILSGQPFPAAHWRSRRQFASVGNVLANRQPHVCGVFQQLSRGLSGRDRTDWSCVGRLPRHRLEQPDRHGFGQFGARSR